MHASHPRATPRTNPAAHSTRSPGGAVLGVAALAVSALLLGACGSDDAAGDQAALDVADLESVQVDSGLPEACLEAFPVALTAPDLADVSLLPAAWPAEPAGATLCQTGATMDGAVETVDYATDSTAAEVLDAYEAALAAYDVSRTDQGLGEQLVGSIDGTAFEITPREGAYTVVLSAS